MLLLQKQNQLNKVIETNQRTKQYGLFLSKRDAELILEERNHALQEEQRVEFGESITLKIINEFCGSDYIDQSNYVTTVVRLQQIFYLYKNEMNDEITDDELLHFMNEQFEFICYGDLDYLEGTCLNIFSQAIRAGYRGYRSSEGRREYAGFDEVKRWDYELYLDCLKELCWR